MHLKAVELFEARSNVLFKRKPWSPSFNISYILVAILIWFAASYWLAARDYLSHSAVLIFLLISLILGVGVLSFSSFAPLLSQVVANALRGRIDHIPFSLEHLRYLPFHHPFHTKVTGKLIVPKSLAFLTLSFVSCLLFVCDLSFNQDKGSRHERRVQFF